MFQTVLVTGANGLIGFDVVKRLRALGRSVVAVDRSVREVATLTDHAVELEIGDAHRLHEVAWRHDVDAIVHCGAVSGPMLGRDNPAMVFRVNVGGTVDAAEVARQIAARRGACRLVLCSSLTVYGNQPQNGIREDAPLLARTCYASSKIAAEAVALSYAEEHGVDSLVLRIAGVYGPRRRTSCVLRLMIGNALAGRPTRLGYGQGFPRQWVHVDDTADGIVLALDAETRNRRIFNLSGGINPTIDEAAAIVRDLLPGADIELAEGPDPEDIRLGLLDITAARQDFNYAPKVDLHTGIAGLVEAVRSQHRQTRL